MDKLHEWLVFASDVSTIETPDITKYTSKKDVLYLLHRVMALKPNAAGERKSLSMK